MKEQGKGGGGQKDVQRCNLNGNRLKAKFNK